MVLKPWSMVNTHLRVQLERKKCLKKHKVCKVDKYPRSDRNLKEKYKIENIFEMSYTSLRNVQEAHVSNPVHLSNRHNMMIEVPVIYSLVVMQVNLMQLLCNYIKCWISQIDFEIPQDQHNQHMGWKNTITRTPRIDVIRPAKWSIKRKIHYMKPCLL